MNKIEKLKAELRHYEKKYEELIAGHVQSEINKVDSDIKASCLLYTSDAADE